ncbi:MAG: hypothetical protein ACP5DX_04070 [Paracoccaceae bacterium]
MTEFRFKLTKSELKRLLDERQEKLGAARQNPNVMDAIGELCRHDVEPEIARQLLVEARLNRCEEN